MRRLGPGAWKLTVTGVHADGTNHRLYRTVRFGEMRRAGLSRSRMNQGRSLCSPFFREDMTTRNPMLGFELPTSIHVSREIFPPEVEEVALLLSTAFEVVPRGRREDRHSARRRSVPVQPRAGLNVGDDPDHLTSRVAVLKSHLGIEDKKPTTIAAEEKALRLYRREPQPRPSTAVPTARKIG